MSELSLSLKYPDLMTPKKPKKIVIEFPESEFAILIEPGAHATAVQAKWQPRNGDHLFFLELNHAGEPTGRSAWCIITAMRPHFLLVPSALLISYNLIRIQVVASRASLELSGMDANGLPADSYYVENEVGETEL